MWINKKLLDGDDEDDEEEDEEESSEEEPVIKPLAFSASMLTAFSTLMTSEGVCAIPQAPPPRRKKAPVRKPAQQPK